MHADNLTIGIVGLGLIGGSIAKAFRENTYHRVLGYDKSEKALSSAVFCSAIEESLEGKYGECDILVMALYPKDTVEFIKEHASAGSWRRGYEYHTKDMVFDNYPEKNFYMAKVKGNFQDHYNTDLIFKKSAKISLA